jgi:hypothetical protein
MSLFYNKKLRLTNGFKPQKTAISQDEYQPAPLPAPKWDGGGMA